MDGWIFADLLEHEFLLQVVVVPRPVLVFAADRIRMLTVTRLALRESPPRSPPNTPRTTCRSSLLSRTNGTLSRLVNSNASRLPSGLFLVRALDVALLVLLGSCIRYLPLVLFATQTASPSTPVTTESLSATAATLLPSLGLKVDILPESTLSCVQPRNVKSMLYLTDLRLSQTDSSHSAVRVPPFRRDPRRYCRARCVEHPGWQGGTRAQLHGV